jgi:hypothetical protein
MKHDNMGPGARDEPRHQVRWKRIRLNGPQQPVALGTGTSELGGRRRPEKVCQSTLSVLDLSGMGVVRRQPNRPLSDGQGLPIAFAQVRPAHVEALIRRGTQR